MRSIFDKMKKGTSFGHLAEGIKTLIVGRDLLIIISHLDRIDITFKNYEDI